MVLTALTMEDDEVDVQTDLPPSVTSDNTTSNLTDLTALDDLDLDLFLGYSTALLRFASACCVLFMLVGIPGNLITIIALFRCKKVTFTLIYSHACSKSILIFK